MLWEFHFSQKEPVRRETAPAMVRLAVPKTRGMVRATVSQKRQAMHEKEQAKA